MGEMKAKYEKEMEEKIKSLTSKKTVKAAKLRRKK